MRNIIPKRLEHRFTFQMVRRIIPLLLVVLFVSCANEKGHRKRVAELSQGDVEILWDTWGIPHINANDDESLFFAFGYCQMQSHAELILRLYGKARGRAAEYWGEAYLQSDRWNRTMKVSERAQEWYAAQKPTGKRHLDAFTAGMNHYAEEYLDRIDDEVEIVLPIQPEDPLAHFQQAIQFTFVSNSSIVDRAAKENGMEPAGSNAWAIAPSRSASGHAMLLANPHLPWGDLFTWYEAHHQVSGLNAYGAALVGTPMLSIAFNDFLGWTHTVNTYDGTDLYELTLEEGGYQWDGGVRAFEQDEQTLKVKRKNGGFREEKLSIRYSVHGPVIASDKDRAIALRVAGLDRPNLIDQYWDMIHARNLQEFETALKHKQMPMFTVMYADRDGHIMHLFGGLVPKRAPGDWNWRGTVPGNTSETLWTEYHAYDDLPRIVDPESGWLQNANDPPWTTTFPRTIDPKQFPRYMAPRFMHYRAQRSARMLDEDSSITYDEMIEYKHSTRMELADRILDELITAARKSDNNVAQQAADVLWKWDRTTDSDSTGGILFEAFIRGIPQKQGRFFATRWSTDSPRTTPNGLANPEKAVDALIAVAKEVEKKYGRLDVPWGESHRLIRDDVDLPANGGGGSLGIFRVTGYSPMKDGRFKASGGDSYVAAVEFSDPVKARALIGYGNASQPCSPHRTDQLELFSRKRLRPVWLTRDEIIKNLELRQVLTRKAGSGR